MLRLDHNRAASQIAAKIGCAVGDIEKLAVWGNHSPTMYADYRFATVNGKSVKDTINDHDWNANVFLPTVGKRGAAIIAARGLSSAASAANAAIDHMRDWALGTNGKWVTMGIPSNGDYGIPKEVMFGYPVTCEGGEYKIVEGLPIDAFSQECINKTLAELQGEQDGVKHLLRLPGGNSRSVTITAAWRRGCSKACNSSPNWPKSLAPACSMSPWIARTARPWAARRTMPPLSPGSPWRLELTPAWRCGCIRWTTPPLSPTWP
jgi:hypothetical protein